MIDAPSINECALWCTNQIDAYQYIQLHHIWIVGIVLFFLIVHKSLTNFDFDKLRLKSSNTKQFMRAKKIIERIRDVLLSTSIYSLVGFLVYHIFWVL